MIVRPSLIVPWEGKALHCFLKLGSPMMQNASYCVIGEPKFIILHQKNAELSLLMEKWGRDARSFYLYKVWCKSVKYPFNSHIHANFFLHGVPWCTAGFIVIGFIQQRWSTRTGSSCQLAVTGWHITCVGLFKRPLHITQQMFGA